MTLVKKTVSGREYYTDGEVYYTFHQITDAADTLWSFACIDLGITKKTGFTSQETKEITDLAGIGPRHPGRFLLLKNDQAVPIPYLASGSANLHPKDIILHAAADPAAPTSVKTQVPLPDPTKSVAERLKAVEELHDGKLLTDPEYQDQRARIIAEL